MFPTRTITSMSSAAMTINIHLSWKELAHFRLSIFSAFHKSMNQKVLVGLIEGHS